MIPIVVLTWCVTSEAQLIRMTDVTHESGVDFIHTDGRCGEYFIVEAMCAGLAIFDFDGDGDADIYFLNGSSQCRDADRAAPAGNRLYRNDGHCRFTDVTQVARVGDTQHGLGVATGDFDNDGHPDIYVNNYGPNVLYRNLGNGTFENVTASAGVENGDRVGAGVCFVDLNADGHLDLYVGNYIRFSPEIHVPRSKRGFAIYGGPSDYQADSDTVYMNQGDGTFRDATQQSRIGEYAAPSMGIVCSDYDRDGDADVLIANDGEANYLFENDGKGRFVEVGLERGFAYDMAGKVHASMGVDSGDYDNDGWMDFHVTSYQQESATLYRNIDGALLDDASVVSRAGLGTRAPMTWGNGFADFNNDGHRDLFVACGHIYDKLAKFDKSTTYHTPNLLFQNRGTGIFDNISSKAGSGLQVAQTSRGAAFADLDNDGDVDVVVLNAGGKPSILRNDTQSQNAWVQIALTGRTSNRSGIGARVTVQAGDKVQIDEVRSGRGYQSDFGRVLQFGLSSAKQVDSIEVAWPSGRVTKHGPFAVNRRIRLNESDETR